MAELLLVFSVPKPPAKHSKRKGFVIYPGKISYADTFRIGNIGDVFPQDMEALLQAIKEIR